LPSDEGWGRGRRPVINVSWHDANTYVSWLSRKSGKTYRLLTEAEWEYAARAGTTGRWSFDGDEARICVYGNHVDQSVSHVPQNNARFSDGIGEQTAEVGRYRPNAFGLYDMHGNVWEWVQDCFKSYEGAPSDGAAVHCSAGPLSLVVRGGAWNDFAPNLRSAIRNGYDPTARNRNVGFRVARTL
jgi:formylglycine-generating enzyme required for sulfatase activity